MANYLRNAWSQESKFRWSNFTLCRQNSVVTWHEFEMSFLIKTQYITSNTHVRKMRLIADVIAEIFKFKNCSVGNCVKCISSEAYLHYRLTNEAKLEATKLCHVIHCVYIKWFSLHIFFFFFFLLFSFLAHLSRRLTRWAYILDKKIETLHTFFYTCEWTKVGFANFSM